MYACYQPYTIVQVIIYIFSGLVKFVDQLVSEGVIIVQGGSGAGGVSTQPTQPTPAAAEDDLQRG